MVYARFASGYRAGGPNANVPGNSTAPKSYEPDKDNSFDVGIKGEVWDHRLTFDAAAYYIDWKNVQIAVIDQATQFLIHTNGGNAKSQGLELSAQARPTSGLKIAASATFGDAKLKDALPAISTAVGAAGERLPFSSRFAGSLSVDQEFALFGTWTGSVGGSLRYVGEREADFISGPQAVRSTLPGYTQVDLRADARRDDWTVGLFVNNVSDKRGFVGRTEGGPSNRRTHRHLYPTANRRVVGDEGVLILRLHLALSAYLLLGGGVTAGQNPVQDALFSLDDLGTLVRLSKPALSPDGKLVALIVSRPDPLQNQVASTLVLIDSRTGASRTITTGKVSSPIWSPSGRSLAWLTPDADNTRQIMLASLVQASGTPIQLTHVVKGAGVRAFAWSPDEQSMAYLAEEHAAPPVADARFDRTFELADSDYLGTTYLARTRGEGPAQLWLIGAQGGTARLLRTNGGYLQDLAWSADGKSLVVNSNPGTSEVSARFGSVRMVEVLSGHEALIVAMDAHVSSESRIDISSQECSPINTIAVRIPGFTAIRLRSSLTDRFATSLLHWIETSEGLAGLRTETRSW